MVEQQTDQDHLYYTRTFVNLSFVQLNIKNMTQKGHKTLFSGVDYWYPFIWREQEKSYPYQFTCNLSIEGGSCYNKKTGRQQ